MSIQEIHELFIKSSGVVTDSRKIKNNCIFFSLKGKNFNGNEFAKSAIENGAIYAVIDEEKYFEDKENYILVNDTLATLQQLANFHRKKIKTKIIGITGSNGKTTTKELINSVLKTHFKTYCTKGNLNNHIGVLKEHPHPQQFLSNPLLIQNHFHYNYPKLGQGLGKFTRINSLLTLI